METSSALMFTAYMVPVGLVDNVLRPLVMARGLTTPMPVIFIGVVGGTLAYGISACFSARSCSRSPGRFWWLGCRKTAPTGVKPRAQRPSHPDRTIRQGFERPLQYRCGKKLRRLYMSSRSMESARFPWRYWT
jgi:hypothetical protein